MPYKDKQAEADAKRRHYEKNKEAINRRSKERAQRVRKAIQAIKEASPCADCNINYPYYVMQFDHLGEQDKIGNVSKLISHRGESIAMAEIEKCDIVCANCLALRSWTRMQKCYLDTCDRMSSLVVIDGGDHYTFCSPEHRFEGE